jgi:hypothetical protein
MPYLQSYTKESENSKRENKKFPHPLIQEYPHTVKVYQHFNRDNGFFLGWRQKQRCPKEKETATIKKESITRCFQKIKWSKSFKWIEIESFVLCVRDSNRKQCKKIASPVMQVVKMLFVFCYQSSNVDATALRGKWLALASLFPDPAKPLVEVDDFLFYYIITVQLVNLSCTQCERLEEKQKCKS